MPTVAIAGGYGTAGRALAKAIVALPGWTVRIGGPNAQKAQKAAEEIGCESGTVDLGALESIDAFLKGADWFALACPANWTRQASEGALRNGCHWLDLQLSLPKKLEVLESLGPEFAAKGLSCVTDGGFHPGLPATLVRWALARRPETRKAVVYSLIRTDWSSVQVSESTATEFCTELAEGQTTAKVGSRWRKLSFREMPKFDFGDPFGNQQLFPMKLEELTRLPEAERLEECGFYVSGFGGTVDWIELPIAMAAARLGYRAQAWAGQRLFRALKRQSRPPFETRLVLVDDSGPVLQISHPDAYWLTGAPCGALLAQIGERPPTGFHFQAHLLDPNRTLEHLASMGVQVERLRE